MAEYDVGTPEYDAQREGRDYGPDLTDEKREELELKEAQRQESLKKKREYIDKKKQEFSNLSLEEMEERLAEATSQIADIEEGRSEHQKDPFLAERIFMELIEEKKEQEKQV